ncbi:glycosyltransferase family 2 protein, partial [bacterium]
MDRVILLLPAYNEEPRIPNTIRMVKTAIENIKNYSFTILV